MATTANKLIRLACYEDLACIQRLYKELRPHDPERTHEEAEAAWRGLLREWNVRLIVAEHEGQVVATCMLAFIPNFASGGRPIGFVEHVITLAEFRGRGFAKAVMEYALELAWEKNCCKVVLLSGAQRTEAHRLYESLGFKGDTERGFVIKPE